MISSEYCLFRPLAQQECGQVIALIQSRISWMDSAGISQWNHSHYLETYPLSYFEQRAQAHQLYGLFTRENSLAAAAVLLEADPRWNGQSALPAYYIHNFVSGAAFCGAGAALIEHLIALARAEGKSCLRLDCAVNNEKLNQYYIRFGFRYVGPMEDGEYLGNLRQYDLK